MQLKQNKQTNKETSHWAHIASAFTLSHVPIPILLYHSQITINTTGRLGTKSSEPADET